MKKLEIDIISDVVCPWCVIGFGRLQEAIEQLSDQIDVRYRRKLTCPSC